MAVSAGPLAESLNLLSDKTKEIRHKRELEVIQALSGVQELTSATSKFIGGDTYRVVLSQPVGGTLNARADGMLDAFVKGDDGKIVAVARLQKAGTVLVSSAMALAGHAMLLQISAQIGRLQGAVEQVLARMDTERLGKVDAALAFLKHAPHYRPEHYAAMLLDAVQTLSGVLAGALRDVAQAIEAVPEPQSWHLARAVWDTSDRTGEALDRAAASMRVVLLCLTALGQAQLHLNDEAGAANIMGDWLRQALGLPLNRAELLARRLHVLKEEERRDRFWIDVRYALGRALEKVTEMLDAGSPAIVQFEATGAELVASLTIPATAPAAVVEPASGQLRADPVMRRR